MQDLRQASYLWSHFTPKVVMADFEEDALVTRLPHDSMEPPPPSPVSWGGASHSAGSFAGGVGRSRRRRSHRRSASSSDSSSDAGEARPADRTALTLPPGLEPAPPPAQSDAKTTPAATPAASPLPAPSDTPTGSPAATAQRRRTPLFGAAPEPAPTPRGLAGLAALAPIAIPPPTPADNGLATSRRFLKHAICLADVKLGEKIGEGSFGEVYKGTLYGQEIALKKMRVTQDALKEFKKEVRIMTKLRHPNIVEFLGAAFDNNNNMCIVTEFCTGGSLENLLRRLETDGKKLRKKRMISIAKDIARGLNWLHHKGIIHRDLKPANLLIDENRRVKIADFGLSHVKQSTGGAVGLYGTPCYMAPEVIRKQVYDVKADIFSFGVVLYELVTGRYPYEGAAKSSITFERDVLAGMRPEIASEACSPEMRTLIQQCWAEKPEDRPMMDTIMERLYLIEEHEKIDYSFLDDLAEEAADVFRNNTTRIAEMNAVIERCKLEKRDMQLKIDKLSSQLRAERQRNAVRRGRSAHGRRVVRKPSPAVSPAPSSSSSGTASRNKRPRAAELVPPGPHPAGAVADLSPAAASQSSSPLRRKASGAAALVGGGLQLRSGDAAPGAAAAAGDGARLCVASLAGGPGGEILSLVAMPPDAPDDARDMEPSHPRDRERDRGRSPAVHDGRSGAAAAGAAAGAPFLTVPLAAARPKRRRG